MTPQIPSASASVMRNAHYFVHLASATYLDDPTEYEHYDAFALQEMKTIAGDASFVVAGRLDDALLVACRGSDDAEDWWHNANFRQVDDYVGRVHEGFYDAAEAIWKKLVGYLDKIWKRGDTLWLAGHSLGGAMATLLAKWLDHYGYDRIAGVFTFGQPRVGNNDFADAYSAADAHYRFVNNKDIVPQVPLRWMGPGVHYKHVGQLYHFDEAGDLSKSDKTWNELAAEFAEITLLRGPLPKGQTPDFGFEDHGIGHYIEKIEAYLRG